MELTKAEIASLKTNFDIKRINCFVGDGITDIMDIKQRQKVMVEIQKAMDQIANGESEIIEDIDSDMPQISFEDMQDDVKAEAHRKALDEWSLNRNK